MGRNIPGVAWKNQCITLRLSDAVTWGISSGSCHLWGAAGGTEYWGWTRTGQSKCCPGNLSLFQYGLPTPSLRPAAQFVSNCLLSVILPLQGHVCICQTELPFQHLYGSGRRAHGWPALLVYLLIIVKISLEHPILILWMKHLIFSRLWNIHSPLLIAFFHP